MKKNVLILVLTALIFSLLVSCEKDKDLNPNGNNGNQPSQPVASFTCDKISGDAPLTVYFTSTSSGSINSYYWSFGNISSANNLNPMFTFSNAGTYTVTLEVSGPGGRDTYSRTITVNQPNNKIAYSISGSYTKLSNALGTHLNSNVRFVRFTNDDRWIIAYGQTGFQSYGQTAMNTALSNNANYVHSPACYVDSDKWLVAYGSDAYSSSGLPSGLTNKMYSNSSTNRRVDFDKNGNWVYLTQNQFSYTGFSSSSPVITNLSSLPGVKGFAFGETNNSVSWVVYSDTDFRASSNVPSALLSNLNSIKNASGRFIDIEISGTSWVVVYK